MSPMNMNTSEQNKYARTLIISNNSFCATGGNGKTMGAMFKGWPKDNLAQIYVQEFDIPDFSVCTKYYHLNDKSILKRFLSFGLIKTCGAIVTENIQPETIKTQNTSRSNFIRTLSVHREKVKVFRDILWKTKLWRTNDLINWLEEYNPEVIFLHGGDYTFSFELSRWIAKKRNISIAIYFTDNYVINPHISGLISLIQYYRLLHCYKEMINFASKKFVIGELMADAFRDKFHSHFYHIMNIIDFPTKSLPKHNKISNNEIVLVYMGGLHSNRWETILEIGRLIEEIRNKILENIIFEVYSIDKLNDKILKKFNSCNIHFKGGLTQNEVAPKLKEADILVHVESFQKKYRKLTSLSISTKIPEYLSSGNCLLGFGPSEVASIRLIKENNIGVVITDLDNSDKKVKIMSELLLDSSLRREIGENGYNYAWKFFNGDETRKKFRAILSDARNKK